MSRYPSVDATESGVPSTSTAPPRLGLPGVDEVVGADGHAVGPHRLGVDLVDDGLGVDAHDLGAVDHVGVELRATSPGPTWKTWAHTALATMRPAARVARHGVVVQRRRDAGRAPPSPCRPRPATRGGPWRRRRGAAPGPAASRPRRTARRQQDGRRGQTTPESARGAAPGRGRPARGTDGPTPPPAPPAAPAVTARAGPGSRW